MNLSSNLSLFWDHFVELAKKAPFEDAGGSKGSQTELQLSLRRARDKSRVSTGSPKGPQREPKGAQRDPKGNPRIRIITFLFLLFFSFLSLLFFVIFFLPYYIHRVKKFYKNFRQLDLHIYCLYIELLRQVLKSDLS